MNFISISFIVFLVAVFLIFILLPERARKPMLLVASYLFYATWSIPFVAVILLTTTVDYWMGRRIMASTDERGRRAALAIGLVLNLLALGFFKYANFLLANGYHVGNFLGWTQASPPILNIILPLGISFYTFEAISYLVDVYRGGKLPDKNWLEYNFYIMYFPHLISGPIIRFCELWPQYDRPLQLPSRERLKTALDLIILGFAFKIMLADQVAGFADHVFSDPGKISSLEALLGTMAFTVQIYFDFMGYTHIARGISLLFNIELPLNFNHPYLATNISNFWERWHISLSRWIRDYLYFPMGGSRCGLNRTALNLVVTMLIAGAWHGAGWTYIAWGGFHGILLAVYHYYKYIRDHILNIRPQIVSSHLGYRFTSWFLTFVAVMTGWVFFRSPNFSVATTLIKEMFNIPSLAYQVMHKIATGQFTDLLIVVSLFACCVTGPWVIRWIESLYRPLPFWQKVSASCLLLLFCWVISSESIQPFIYFQF
jgi:alginate O-acetyltransferase complex protein AlgI